MRSFSIEKTLLHLSKHLHLRFFLLLPMLQSIAHHTKTRTQLVGYTEEVLVEDTEVVPVEVVIKESVRFAEYTDTVQGDVTNFKTRNNINIVAHHHTTTIHPPPQAHYTTSSPHPLDPWLLDSGASYHIPSDLQISHSTTHTKVTMMSPLAMAHDFRSLTLVQLNCPPTLVFLTCQMFFMFQILKRISFM